MNLIFSGRSLRVLSLASLAACVFYSFTTNQWVLFIGSYIYFRVVINFFAKSIALHRYFSHNSFATTKSKHDLLTAISVLAGQGSPFEYSMIHRHHHIHSDTDKDIHSPKQGFWHSVFLWSMQSAEWFFQSQKVSLKKTADLTKNKFVYIVNKNYYFIWFALIILTVLIHWKITLFFLLAPVGFEVLHNGLMSSYLSHKKLYGSYRNFETADDSANYKFLVFIQTGEAFHNNHHQFPTKYNMAFRKDEFDLAGWVIDRWLCIECVG